jgi:segregation and condensation protein B
MTTSNKTAAVEALLFIHGEALTKKKIMSVLDMSAGDLETALEALKANLAREERGLALMVNGDKIQLATKAEFGSIMAEFVKDELTEDLTPAALEALSLILYLGPIHRSQLDYLRGVNSSFIVRSLMLRGLVERYPDPTRPSIFLYRGTMDALRHLGVGSTEELPEYGKFRELATMQEKEELKNEPARPGNSE